MKQRIDLHNLASFEWEWEGVLLCNCHHPLPVNASVHLPLGSETGLGRVDHDLRGLAYAMLHSEHPDGLVLSVRDRYFLIEPKEKTYFAIKHEVGPEAFAFTRVKRSFPVDPEVAVREKEYMESLEKQMA